jgi:hypothetical protein
MPRTPPTPTLWRTLTRYVGLHEDAAAQWWTVLHQAQSAKPQAWLRQLQFYDARQSWNQAPEVQQRYLVRSMPPKQLVEVLEALVEEGLLTRRCGNALEDAVLLCVDAHGQWNEDTERKTSDGT